jgi:hypothetical protein
MFKNLSLFKLTQFKKQKLQNKVKNKMKLINKIINKNNFNYKIIKS